MFQQSTRSVSVFFFNMRAEYAVPVVASPHISLDHVFHERWNPTQQTRGIVRASPRASKQPDLSYDTPPVALRV